MKHIVIDLEMNKIARSSEVRKICKSEIIEIGAVMLDENLQEIGNFRTYVKPEYNDKIAAEIRNLTGITDVMVANAPVFREAFRMFTNWCLGTGDEVTIYAWSDSDYNQVVKEILLKEYELSDEEHGLIDTEWTDFQNEFDAHIGFERRISLELALDMAGIDSFGRQHDALDDARNTADLLHVFRDRDLFEKTLRKVKEAMDPTPLGNTLGSMIDFSGFVVG